MKSIYLLLFTSLIFLFLATSALSEDEVTASGDHRVYCTTSSDSPTKYETDEAANQLLFLKETCFQKNGGRWGCSGMAIFAGAAIEICGPRGWSVHCDNAGKYAKRVAKDCMKQYGNYLRASGILFHSDGMGYIRVHSPGG